MPKGQTSRPNTREERKAVKTLKSISAGLSGKSTVNQKNIISGPRYGAAQTTLLNRDAKAGARTYGAKKERETGQGLKTRVSYSQGKSGKPKFTATKRK